MAIGTFPGMLQEGSHASRPAATAVGSGALYACSDHALIYQSDGATWSTWATLGGGVVAAEDVTFTPAGSIAATDVQAAIEEVAAEAGGGGGITHNYVGYNTIGGTWLTMTTRQVLMKKFTLASAGYLGAIEAHVRSTSDLQSGVLHGFLFEDNAGTPRHILAYNQSGRIEDGLFAKPGSGSTAGRWLSLGVTKYLAAGDYWMAVQFVGDATTMDIAKDGSGSDRHFTAGGDWVTDAGYSAITTGTDTYSIRASIIT